MLLIAVSQYGFKYDKSIPYTLFDLNKDIHRSITENNKIIFLAKTTNSGDRKNMLFTNKIHKERLFNKF